MTLTEYIKLKNQLVHRFGSSGQHDQILCNLKEKYRNIINSPRRYEQICTIGQLLRILEVRDALSECNVGVLKEIVSHLLNNNDLLQNINDYENSRVPPEIVNYYAPESMPTVPERKQGDSFSSNNLIDKKKQRIIEAVIEDIGIFWRDLARSLNIKERDIDEINESHKKLSMKAKHVMDLFLSKADCQTWFLDLCDALESSRRKDLAKKLKKISVMNM